MIYAHKRLPNVLKCKYNNRSQPRAQGQIFIPIENLPDFGEFFFGEFFFSADFGEFLLNNSPNLVRKKTMVHTPSLLQSINTGISHPQIEAASFSQRSRRSGRCPKFVILRRLIFHLI